MLISYIRPDKHFVGVFEQLKYINLYADQNSLVIDNEYVDHKSQNKTLLQRDELVSYFRSLESGTLIIYDVWVLSSHIEDLVQMFTCLLKNRMTIHIIKQSVVVSKNSNVMLVLGLIDQLRQKLYDETKKSIGRPRGSRSSSKFDQYQDYIVRFLREERSVSEMARELNVSRSSLKDYIESRELREVAVSTTHVATTQEAIEKVIDSIQCPTITNTGE
ncbi:MAG: recombinase family protein [Campylobacterota bacterium]|nr:recombinase family protein [Campylobacterota bacterium]